MAIREFAINRIMQPQLPLPDFIRLAAEIGAGGVEIRNDLEDPSLLGGEEPEVIRSLCRLTGVGIVTVNALQRFNDPELFDEKKYELRSMLETAAKVDCRRIVLCPVNDPNDRRNATRRHDDLVAALKIYAPLFREFSSVGLVEPLGFQICSVRTKGQAVKAIEESGTEDLYQIVHDTFHHYLSGERDMFPVQTGLVHVSGVAGGKNADVIGDDDRLLVDQTDVMDNRGQIRNLLDSGFKGIISFEPFSPEVQNLPAAAIAGHLKESVDYLFSGA